MAFNYGWMPLISQALRGFFATKAQGIRADTALQPSAINNLVQSYNQYIHPRLIGAVEHIPYAISGGGLWKDPTGWLWYTPQGESIGSAASGSNISDNGLAAFFGVLWNNVNVSGWQLQDASGNNSVKGADAASDFAANKRLIIPNLAGRSIFSVGSAPNITNRSVGQILGAEQHTLTVQQMPSHTHSHNNPTHGHGHNNPNHTHGFNGGAHNHEVIVSPDLDARGAESLLIGERVGITGDTSSAPQYVRNTGANEQIVRNETVTGTITQSGIALGITGSGIGLNIQSNGGGQSFNKFPPAKVYTELWFTGIYRP